MEDFLKDFRFDDNKFNFHDFELFFIKQEGLGLKYEKELQHKKERSDKHKRRKEKKLAKMASTFETTTTTTTTSEKKKKKKKKKENNPFLNFQSVEEEENFLFGDYKIPEWKPSLEFMYGYWLPEDEKFFTNKKSILTLKSEALKDIEFDEDNILKVFQRKENLLRIPTSKFGELRRRLEQFRKNNKNLLDYNSFQPLTPVKQYQETIKETPEYFNTKQSIFYDIGDCCNLGNQNDVDGYTTIDDLDEIRKQERKNQRRSFDYKVNFGKIRQFYL